MAGNSVDFIDVFLLITWFWWIYFVSLNLNGFHHGLHSRIVGSHLAVDLIYVFLLITWFWCFNFAIKWISYRTTLRSVCIAPFQFSQILWRKSCGEKNKIHLFTYSILSVFPFPHLFVVTWLFYCFYLLDCSDFLNL